MRILHLTSNDGHAGGARAVERLHGSLLQAGRDSHVVHAGSMFGYAGEVEFVRSGAMRAADKIWRTLSSGVGGASLWRPSSRELGSAVVRIAPDVIHVHWTYGGSGVSLDLLSRLSSRIPVVWTMHDMWLMTGGCTNPQGCERWQTGCGQCPQIARSAHMEKTMDFDVDATSLLWRYKRRELGRGQFRFVAPSGWMRERVVASGIVGESDVDMVRNVVDVTTFAPGDRAAARAELGIAHDALVVLFIGKPGNAAAYAGRHVVMARSVAMLRSRLSAEAARRLTILVVGARGEDVAAELEGVRCVTAGKVDAEIAMSRCFAASDVFLDTTQYDNLPAVVQEALACGVVVVASDVGGIPEIVRPGATGFLADHWQPAQFAEHLMRVLSDDRLRAALGREAVASAQEFAPTVVVPGMIAAYEAAIRECGSSSEEAAK